MIPEKFEEELHNRMASENNKMISKPETNNTIEIRNLSNRELSAKDILKKGGLDPNDDALNGLLDRTMGNLPAKVIPGERILIREDTVVGGCATCSGGKLVGYSKIKFGPKLCWNHRRTKKESACCEYFFIFYFSISWVIWFPVVVLFW